MLAILSYNGFRICKQLITKVHISSRIASISALTFGEISRGLCWFFKGSFMVFTMHLQFRLAVSSELNDQLFLYNKYCCAYGFHRCRHGISYSDRTFTNRSTPFPLFYSIVNTFIMSIPELKAKKIARAAAQEKASVAAAKQAAADASALTKSITARAKQYEAEYAQLEATAINNRRTAKSSGQIYVSPEEKLVFVIRVRGVLNVSPKVKKILQLFRLRQINNGVFVRVNAATIKMLRLIEPFVAYGYPSLKTIKDLIYKRGHGKVTGQRIPLSDNCVISAGLPGTGIECVEDLVHEIFTVGENFKAATNFLWPMKLQSPKGGFAGKGKLNHFNEGGACGQQGDEINKLVKKML
jgi:large subunit ribosomal protein L7e